MTTTRDELERDAWESKHGVGQEVVCDTCRDALVVRFWEGEVCDADELKCSCGGRLRVE